MSEENKITVSEFFDFIKKFYNQNRFELQNDFEGNKPVIYVGYELYNLFSKWADNDFTRKIWAPSDYHREVLFCGCIIRDHSERNLFQKH